MGGPFELTSLRFDPAIDLPDPFDSLMEANGLEIRQEHVDRYFEAAERLSGAKRGGSYHHVLGHPQLIQNDMRGECQLVTNGIYAGEPSGYATVGARELLRTAPDPVAAAATDRHRRRGPGLDVGRRWASKRGGRSGGPLPRS